MKKLLVIAVAVLSFAACRPGAAPSSGGDSLALPTLEGQVYNFTGAVNQRPVVIASVAGFCGYCKMMIPLLDEMAAEYKDKDVDFVLAFVDDEPEDLRDIVKNLNVQNVKVAYNGADFAEIMEVDGFPAIFLMNNVGGAQSIDRWSGYSPEHVSEIKEKLDPMLN
ncbi:MAG: redoxin family protein [Elusimicrobiota bacterium]|nr:redoxin family protein [Elusimicrobiota bacterium]